jgi:LysR family nitrogen assimilation transcriptional regulator
MTLNLTYLRNFIQVLEWGNVSKAALHLNIAQPALSRQIQALEAEFDTKLLRRQNWGVEPTEEGKLVVELANRIEKDCSSTRDNIRSNLANPSGAVYVGVPSNYSVSLAPQLIQRMRLLYPNISVHVVEAFSSAVFEWLINGRLDLAVLYHSKERCVERSLPFLTEEIMAVTLPTMFDGSSSLSLEFIANRQAIVPHRPHLLRLALEAKYQQLGITFVPKLEIDSLRGMIEMAHLGEGVALIAPSSVYRDISEGKLKALPLKPGLQFTTVLGLTSARQPTRLSSIVVDVLHDIAHELAPKLGWRVDFSNHQAEEY